MKKLDYTDTGNITCSYCGYIFTNSSDYEDFDDDETECLRCLRYFYWQRCVGVKYSSEKIVEEEK